MIHRIDETNFVEELKKGKIELQTKFDRWDKIGKLNISDDEFTKKAAYLCRDPTIWAYSTLKDKQNKSLEVYPFQDEIMNDAHRFIHVTAANQIGKTWSGGIIKGLHHAVHTNSGSVMLISRSEDQAKGILDEMKWMLKRSQINWEPFEDEVTNRFEYHIKSPDGTGVTPIRVFPPTEAILSFPATFIVMDETGFWGKQNPDPIAYYQQCVEPRTNTTKNWKHPFLTMGQILSITNPFGQTGLAWWLRNNEEYHNYEFNWLANENNTLEEYKKKEKTINPIIFASTYAAKYVTGASGFITSDQYERFKNYNIPLTIPPGSNIFLGGDFASEEPSTRGRDWTALFGVIQVKNIDYPMYPRIQLVYRKVFPPGTSKSKEIYPEIERLKNLPGVYIAKFGYDKMGVGDSVKSDLIGRGTLVESQIEALTYSLPNKSEVYLNFQNLFHQDLIEGSDIPELQDQILGLKVEQALGSVHIKVHHKTDGVKDDEPDALANACYVAKGMFGFVDSEFISNKAVPKKLDKSIEKGIDSNQQFLDWIEKNKA